jgi:hypothetical protein
LISSCRSRSWKASNGYTGNGGHVELTVGQQVKDPFTVIKTRRHRDQHHGDRDDHGTDAGFVSLRPCASKILCHPLYKQRRRAIMDLRLNRLTTLSGAEEFNPERGFVLRSEGDSPAVQGQRRWANTPPIGTDSNSESATCVLTR